MFGYWWTISRQSTVFHWKSANLFGSCIVQVIVIVIWSLILQSVGLEWRLIIFRIFRITNIFSFAGNYSLLGVTFVFTRRLGHYLTTCIFQLYLLSWCHGCRFSSTVRLSQLECRSGLRLFLRWLRCWSDLVRGRYLWCRMLRQWIGTLLFATHL